ncbi:DUF2474 family protein [Algiphilus sp. W345]|uniref:DUF2474 family protein n=1 Tax=Banduia mediterranea TaxID=3075609 RepID=A0ABU2WLU2_9GAMM|nr:DUF2474 family protein [Algiphilus sp. W345]MDT0498821.1 DUF2474 family protein [Algiphilus sp. W345]
MAGDQTPLWRRLLWFAGLWISGVLAVGVIAYLLRLLLAP